MTLTHEDLQRRVAKELSETSPEPQRQVAIRYSLEFIVNVPEEWDDGFVKSNFEEHECIGNVIQWFQKLAEKMAENPGWQNDCGCGFVEAQCEVLPE